VSKGTYGLLATANLRSWLAMANELNS